MGVFDDIYHSNGWKNDESVSGHGSTLDITANIRAELPTLFAQLGITSVFDGACGDYHWFKEMDLPGIKYTGADIVPELVEADQRKYGDANHNFLFLDITQHMIGNHDMVLVRDVLGHLTNRQVKWALENIRHSGSKYMLATTFPNHHPEGDIHEGQWRPINLEEFWGLSTPLKLINEGETRKGFEDKSLGLWRLP